MKLANFRTQHARLTLTLDTSAYADGDLLADTQALPLTAPQSGTGRAGRLTQLTLIDRDDVGMLMDVVVLSDNKSLGTENAAPSITDDNALEVLAIIPVTSWTDLGGVRIARPGFDPVEFEVDGQNLYLALIARGAGTFTANGIRIRAAVQIDNVEA